MHWLKYHKPFHIILLISYLKCKKSDLVITSGSLRSCFPNFISFSCSRLTDTSFFFFILHSTQTSNWRYFYTELGSKYKISEKRGRGNFLSVFNFSFPLFFKNFPPWRMGNFFSKIFHPVFGKIKNLLRQHFVRHLSSSRNWSKICWIISFKKIL